MEDWASGFRIDEAFHSWGTRFDSLVPGGIENGYASVELPCRSAYGLATVYAEPTAPRPDRPVTAVAYELADTGVASRYLFAELVKRLGPPDDISRDDAPEQANENSVVLHANWKRGKVEIGLSLYGAPRPSDFGNGLGKLYLSPASLALSTPELLLMPPAIAARLAPTTFALWSDADAARWHLSTARSTVLLGGPETSRVHFYDVAPARGGGFTEIGTASWSVRDAHGSSSMKGALEALEAVPGLQIDRHAGHDA